MNTRLQQFLNAEAISQSAFADTIGVARASVSHILAGRNKPGFDFIERMMANYPALNIEWLISGSGRMYKSVSPSDPASVRHEFKPQPVEMHEEDDIFASLEEPHSPFSKSEINTNNLITTDNEPSSNVITSIKQENRTIKKVVVFYSDNTFAEIL